MRLVITSLFIIMLSIFSGCEFRQNRSAENTNTSASTEPAMQSKEVTAGQAAESRTATTTGPETKETLRGGARYEKTGAQGDVSLAQTDAARANEGAAERKIIRNAELNMEVNSPADVQRKITSIAESHGGFVVSSDAKQRDSEDQAKPEMTVTIVVRIPWQQFNAVVGEISSTATHIRANKTTGQDVTEEYLDLEARIKNKKALEAQFVEIMKQARTVSDALEVQGQLSEVRTEIDRLEGRRHYLENQSSLSTITAMLQTPTPLVSTSGFFYNVKKALGNGVDIAASITLFLIQAALALLPVFVLIFLPIGLLVRYLLRRKRRLQLAHKLAHDEPSAVQEMSS